MAGCRGELTVTCAYCSREAGDQCPRCGVQLCSEHRPGSDIRCEECEFEYRSSGSRRAAAHSATTAALVGLLLGLVTLLAAGSGGGAVALAPLILFCTVPVTLIRLELRARARFLAETCDRRLPRAVLLRS